MAIEDVLNQKPSRRSFVKGSGKAIAWLTAFLTGISPASKAVCDNTNDGRELSDHYCQRPRRGNTELPDYCNDSNDIVKRAESELKFRVSELIRRSAYGRNRKKAIRADQSEVAKAVELYKEERSIYNSRSPTFERVAVNYLLEKECREYAETLLAMRNPKKLISRMLESGFEISMDTSDKSDFVERPDYAKKVGNHYDHRFMWYDGQHNVDDLLDEGFEEVGTVEVAANCPVGPFNVPYVDLLKERDNLLWSIPSLGVLKEAVMDLERPDFDRYPYVYLALVDRLEGMELSDGSWVELPENIDDRVASIFDRYEDALDHSRDLLKRDAMAAMKETVKVPTKEVVYSPVGVPQRLSPVPVSADIPQRDLEQLIPADLQSISDNYESLNHLTDLMAKRHGIDRDIIVTFMKEESNFKPWVVSWAGARGIMQVMPRTAKANCINYDHLLDPVIGMEAGCRLLSKYLRRYNGDLSKVARRYNASSVYVAKIVTQYRKVKADPQRYRDLMEENFFSTPTPSQKAQILRFWNLGKRDNYAHALPLKPRCYR